MRYTTLLLCFCSILLLGSCKSQPSAQNGQPLEVMTFNVRLDIPSDSVNNWNYRKGDACRMIAYYSPDLLGMQEVLHNQMEDLKRGLPQYTALGRGARRRQGSRRILPDILPDRPVYTGGIRQFLPQRATRNYRHQGLGCFLQPCHHLGDTAGKEQRTKVCIFQHPSGQRRKDSPQRGRATHSRQNQGDSTGHARHHHW